MVDQYDPKQAIENQPITLTPAALKHIQTMIQKNGHGKGMRLSIDTTGCSGFMYVVTIIDEANADDVVFQQEDIFIAVEPRSFQYLKGTKIDYVQDGLNKHLSYDNPNASGSCGCGESFSIDEE